MSEEQNTATLSEEERRERLSQMTQPGTGSANYNPAYSKFIRWMRLVLPLVALTIVAIVFTWSNMKDDNIVSMQDQTQAARSIGKNELLNPRFESVDDKKQPYTITAKRALQGKKNEELVILEEPVADMLLNNGNWVAIEAKQGAFRQDNQRLLLRGNVQMFHDQGYQMTTAQLDLDLDKNIAWSETEVHAQGPMGRLEAKGLKASTEKGLLLFSGPAKLTIYQAGDSIKNIGGALE